MEKRTKLVIDENRWLRAGWNGGLVTDYNVPTDDKEYEVYMKGKTTDSALLDDATKRMCCLGFASCAAGITKKDITNITSPSDLSSKAQKKIKKHFPWLLDEHDSDSKISQELMTINDNEKISLPRKRAKITKIFANNGVDVIFTR